MKRHTKIVATLGPVSESFEQISSLVKKGMDIARLNFSHGSYEEFEKIVKNIRRVEKTEKKCVLTLQDLQGPKIRIGKLPDEGLVVKKGQTLVFETSRKKTEAIPLPYAPLPKLLKPGHRLFIEDGLLRTKILSIKGSKITVRVEVGGLLKSHKGVNIPDSKLPNTLLLTPKDQKDLAFGVKKLKVDAVALSFVEDAEDLLEIRKRIAKLSKRPVFLIAKIERPKALQNLTAILRAADGLMIARGDLGVEIPAEDVPLEQKRIIEACREAGKPVIVATQILQSMVENPVATRAEISDAATAVFEQTDAFMLSNETATGAYPENAVETLAKVAENTEEAMLKSDFFKPKIANFGAMGGCLEDDQLSKEAWELAQQVKADALIIATEEGYTARAIVRYRPVTPLIIVSNNETTARILNFYWGIRDVELIKGRLSTEKIRATLKRRGTLKGKKKLVLLRLGKSKRSLVILNLDR